jgi:hypothetical protein
MLFLVISYNKLGIRLNEHNSRRKISKDTNPFKTFIYTLSSINEQNSSLDIDSLIEK